ncbi:hypothetical protein [Arcanobacterium pinnipediorum]|uniref:Uncharacterized protein n=1 Tax=Arcanobacterium pinnipediorum TaxID=1503041 RepID=A0ABY5AHN7_9ACTO|nr:hypothetical protein [Arcanobacterium pinnipediorum]USR79365.1 hypothetical protein NG665_08345 [Arcanobacterium pinnipediorum]
MRWLEYAQVGGLEYAQVGGQEYAQVGGGGFAGAHTGPHSFISVVSVQ